MKRAIMTVWVLFLLSFLAGCIVSTTPSPNATITIHPGETIEFIISYSEVPYILARSTLPCIESCIVDSYTSWSEYGLDDFDFDNGPIITSSTEYTFSEEDIGTQIIECEIHILQRSSVHTGITTFFKDTITWTVEVVEE